MLREMAAFVWNGHRLWLIPIVLLLLLVSVLVVTGALGSYSPFLYPL
jgi:hypothetical protein